MRRQRLDWLRDDDLWVVSALGVPGEPDGTLLDLDDELDTRVTHIALAVAAAPIEGVELVAHELDVPLARLQLLEAQSARILVLDQRRLQLLKKANLHFVGYLLQLLLLVAKGGLTRAHRVRHRHAKAAHAHTSPLDDRIDKTFDRVLEEDVADEAYLRVALRPYTRVHHEALAAESLHLALEVRLPGRCFRSLQRLRIVCILPFYRCLVLLMPQGLVSSRVEPEDKLLNVVALRVVKQLLHVDEALAVATGRVSE